eukprot:CAMPEP_0174725648 /NCGR_PEP_ID=MMETSP1094-20130205/46108_1 /TAXON_ID=156173 /ORGANISM="Chrysochromulina brevifilum, Strain UTEX LB 985" /LENGTH=125 /DNA_ID=CAMNT_0015927093 /DNA_START=59 /DNA_END=437 /DNA_ORIENTATION=+
MPRASCLELYAQNSTSSHSQGPSLSAVMRRIADGSGCEVRPSGPWGGQLDKAAIVEDKDQVRIEDSIRTARDGDDRDAGELCPDSAMDESSGLRVDGTCRLVEQDQGWLKKHDAGNTNELTLAWW